MRILRSQGGGGKEDTASASYTRYDPLLGWSHLAGAAGTYRRREYTVEVKINSQGRRDRERSPKPLPGVFRLLALGDSFVEAYTVPQEQGVAPQLESALSLGGCPVEVVNGGVQGYSTDQQYLYWKSAGRSLQPNLVVLFLYHNDILANDMAHYWGTPKPLLVWRRGQLELTTDPVPRREPRAPAAAAVDEHEGSALLQFVEERLKRGSPRLWDALAAYGVLNERDRPQPRDEMRVYTLGPTPRMNGAWLKTRLILDALRQGVAADGGRLLIVYVPARFEVDDASWDLTRYNYRMDERWDRGLVARRLAALGREIGAPVHDLTGPLREAGGASTYFAIDNHWNATGHRVAGASVAAFLRQIRWLPACPGDGAKPGREAPSNE
jgi:hypothetical protein